MPTPTQAAPDTADTDPLPPLTGRYLLLVNVPLYRGVDGRAYADPLWHRDLIRHLDYIHDLKLACPVVTAGTAPADARALQDDPLHERLRLVPLPATSSAVQALLKLPLTAWRIWRAVRDADLVHAGIAGWPIPYGWIAAPIARLLRKPLVIIVESAPWRLQPGIPASLKSRFNAWVFERLGRWCVGNASLAIFTQEQYRASFLRRRPGGHVIHASWINADLIIPEQQAREIWHHKTTDPAAPLRLLYAGRLEAEKGVQVLLEAVQRLARDNHPVVLDILGTGSLAGRCVAAGEQLQAATRINMLGTVAYGSELFGLMRQYHALVVPSISDEQPRIVYDAYSQALPVLGTRTAGLSSCISDGRTGWLVEPNHHEQLAALILRAQTHPAALRTMGLGAVEVARNMTHQHMHRTRQRLLLQLQQPGRPQDIHPGG